MNHKLISLLLILVFSSQTAFPAEQQKAPPPDQPKVQAKAQPNVQIVRDDPESPFVSIAKSTFYGAALGTVVALSIMLLASGSDGDIFKVSFVTGTALGLGYGIYHVATRPSSQTALLNITHSHATLNLPQLRIKRSEQSTLDTSMNLLLWNF